MRTSLFAAAAAFLPLLHPALADETSPAPTPEATPETIPISEIAILDNSTAQVIEEPFPYEFPALWIEDDTVPTVARRYAHGKGCAVKNEKRTKRRNDDPFPMQSCNGYKLEEATIDQMQEWMARGKLSSVDIVLCYIRRIQQTDDYIRAIMELNPDYLQIAATLDRERARGKVRGPLHGIPFLVKDNIGTKDKMETTAGSWSLLGSVVPRDAHVVTQLRDAGAVLLGKATLSEWADMRSNDYSEGFSARGGQARSPYNLVVNPGGSSTGSATSVAANQVAFAIGTETDGSVINPAMRNSLVGIKPTVGLTSRAGVVPETSHQDSIGTLARTFRDAVYALDAIYGVDQRDNYTLAQTGRVPTNGYSQFLSTKSALKGARFGVPWSSFWHLSSPGQLAELTALISHLESLGATVVNGTEFPSAPLLVDPNGWNWDYGTTRGYANESEYTVVKVDFYNDIAAYLADLSNTDIRSLQDIVDYNIANAGSEGGLPGVHPAFASGQDGFLASLATGGVQDETYWQALGFIQKQSRDQGIDWALYNHGEPVDALLIPPDVAQSVQVAAMAGYPVVTVPVGLDEGSGMGYGIGLTASAWEEQKLVKLGSAIEDALKGTRWGRKAPGWRSYKERIIPVPF